MSILIVDDEADLENLVRQKFRRHIASGELEFVFALNGEQALEKLEADHALDIVVSDINMPVMDGLTLLSNLVSYSRPLKTIMVSAYDDMPNIRTAMNRGAYDFLTKPIDFTDLETTLERTRRELETIRAGRQAREHLTLLHSELEIAMRIQQSILPETITGHKGFEISASMLPARQVSGDFYDFFLIDANRLGVCIGDVSGKGIPAALFMAVSRTLLRATALHGAPPKDCLAHVNDVLLRQSKGELFVTLFYAIVDLRTGDLHFSAGGQTAPCLLTGDSQLDYLREPRGFMLGLFDDAQFTAGHAKLNPGDVLILYTDGVTEAEDERSMFYTEARLTAALTGMNQAPAQQIVTKVVSDVNKFTSGNPQTDDITVLAVRYCGAP
ncbi:MAG: SpoIIE family protein phosphatase [Acidobacteriota bacterium]|nr:SpoIIE family protein phosphatase [Acidobacteriota bacterium]